MWALGPSILAHEWVGVEWQPPYLPCNTKVVLLMPIHLLLYWAVSIIEIAGSEYGSILKVARKSSRFLRVADVGHKCVGTTNMRPKSICCVITMTHAQTFFQCVRKIQLMVDRCMKYGLELVLQSLQLVKTAQLY